LEAWVNTHSFGRHAWAALSHASGSTPPSGSTDTYLTLMSRSFHSRYSGRRTLLCSASVDSTASPGFSGKPWMARFRPQVELGPRAMRSGADTPMSRASARRVWEKTSKLSMPPRWAEPGRARSAPATASATQSGLGKLVAALFM
jgi:hypothetical protein